ncbi:DNA/RNA non-specific endonuclease [Phenylobacterium aquaticum]|uniref:DNA/RNA non-specific endonuclease n=1 Tax=Phenylobacterium aquaticum TaxID=1763816 RepID=UPI0026EBFC68|nr:DNA/RNA non-specific endonuclease [Phenylobacterium aquaticum]
MALAPRGTPRAVTGSTGELYKKLFGSQEGANGSAASPLAAAASAVLPTIGQRRSYLDLRPSLSETVTIGGQTYKEADNGRANVLVPIDDPLISSAMREDQRRAISRVMFMADHPLGGAAYGLASLANAPQGTRDAALVAGGVADVALLGAGARGAAAQVKPAPPRRQVAPPMFTRPSSRLSALNAKGQATGVSATLTRSTIVGGTKANRKITPPGWLGDGKTYKESRGHLQARSLGGTGDDMRDLVTIKQNPTNTPQMSTFEDAVRRRVLSGEVIDYFVKPLYTDAALRPFAILMTALGSRGEPKGVVIQNPPGKPDDHRKSP